jgi:ABC-type dipeptide/oligopeptide/nickel transport system permease component
MLNYVIKRLLYGLLTIWFLITATFFAMHAIPADPLSGDKALPAQIKQNLLQYYGLDKSLSQQYFIYLGNVLRGDFGYSYTQQNRRVNDIIREHFPVSAILGVLALSIASIGGVLLGAVTAQFHYRWPDALVMAVVIASISVPSFVFAALAQLAILHINRWFDSSLLPVAGWGTFRHMLVPALILGLGTLAYITRLMRANLVEVMQSDYIRTAHAKGLSQARIFLRHQLRNALLPVITILGPAVVAVTTGGFVVEQVFAIPGLGRYFVQAVAQLDYTVIMGTTVFYGSFLVLMVVLVDLFYGLIDPRIRLPGIGR